MHLRNPFLSDWRAQDGEEKLRVDFRGVSSSRDHVLRDVLAELNARVETRRRQVKPAVVGCDVELHVRVVEREAADFWS